MKTSLGFAIVIYAISTFSPPVIAATGCDAKGWITYKGTTLKTMPSGNAYFYVTKRMAIDADGAPNAYEPKDQGLDALANAGYPNGHWKSVLVVDPSNAKKPFLQLSGEFTGFFVAKTSLEDKNLATTDTKRYVDSRTIPYLVFPGAFYQLNGTGALGDVAIVKNLDSGAESPAIIADFGPTNAPLGEVSIRLAENLGGSSINPRNGSGMPKGRFLYVVFPRSKSVPPWPRTEENLKKTSEQLLSQIGGWDRVTSCVATP